MPDHHNWSLAYMFAADNICLSSFNLLWCAVKDATLLPSSAYRPFMVIQGR